jgi:hypothetical protein
MPCGAEMRPRLHDPHWVCQGTDLVIVIEGSPTRPPAVLRGDLLGAVDEPTAAFISRSGTQTFLGGDHLHICLPGA